MSLTADRLRQANIANGDDSQFADEKTNVTLGSTSSLNPLAAAGSSFVLNPLAGVVRLWRDPTLAVDSGLL